MKKKTDKKVKKEFVTKKDFEDLRKQLNVIWLPQIQMHTDRLDALDFASKHNAASLNKLFERVEKLEEPKQAQNKEEKSKTKKCNTCEAIVPFSRSQCSPCFFKRLPDHLMIYAGKRKSSECEPDCLTCYCIEGYECMQHYAKRVVRQREKFANNTLFENYVYGQIKKDIRAEDKKIADRQKEIEDEARKPKVGEIWKTKYGSYFLIKLIKNTTAAMYFEGNVIIIKQYWFRNPTFERNNSFSDPTLFAEKDLKEKIC